MAEEPEDTPRTVDHHMRRRVLRRLHDSDDPLGATRIAGLVEEPLGNVNYHLEVLDGSELVEVVAEKQVRGTIEHFYASLVEDDEMILALLEATRGTDERMRRARRRMRGQS